MSQVSFQGYDAIIRGDGSVRYRFDKKLIKFASVPPTIKDKLDIMADELKADNRPKVVEAPNEAMSGAPLGNPNAFIDEEDITNAGIVAEATSKPMAEFDGMFKGLTPNVDWQPSTLEAPETPAPLTMEQEEARQLATYEAAADAAYAAEHVERRAQEAQDQRKTEAIDPGVNIDVINSLTAMSIHEAPLSHIAMALKERFGIYTVFLGEFPTDGQINPITGEALSRFEVGQFYQSAVKAQARGIIDRDYSGFRDGKVEEAAHLRAYHSSARADEGHYMDAGEPDQPNTPKRLSFEERTSVESANGSHQRTVTYDNDSINEDPVTEPPLRGQIVDRNW